MRSALPALLFVVCAACSSGVTLTKDGGGSGGAATTGGGSGGGGIPDGGPPLGSACTPPTTGTDPCAASGLACTTSAGKSTCELPGLDQACLPAVGCAAGGSCVGVGTSTYACFQSCATTSDCANTSSSCQAYGAQHICNGNLCGPDVPAGYTSSGAAYYAPCDSSVTGDGFCLPDQLTGLGLVGLCFAMAPADAGLPAQCSINRDDAGALCPQGTFCLTNLATNHGACLPACAAAAPLLDGGLSGCAAGASCFPFGGGASFGVCLGPCASQASCAAGLTCEGIAALGADAGDVCAP